MCTGHKIGACSALRWEAPLSRFKKRLAAGEDVFGDLLDKLFLNNGHRVTVVTLPKAELTAARDADEARHLQKQRDGMSPEDIESVLASTKALKLKQETPDSAEALKCIPSLQLSDISRDASTVPTDVASVGGTTVLTHDLFTTNILYADVAFPLSRVPARLLPLLPLFCHALTEMGTEKESFVELSERIDRTTGGMSISPLISHKRGESEPVALLTMRCRAMGDKTADMFVLMRDVLLTAKLDDKARFKQMVLESKASMEASVIGAGHRYAAGRLSAQRSVSAWVSEQMGGLEKLHFVRDLAARIDTDWDAIKQDLESLRHAILASEVCARVCRLCTFTNLFTNCCSLFACACVKALGLEMINHTTTSGIVGCNLWVPTHKQTNHEYE
jgi:presequence protease